MSALIKIHATKVSAAVNFSVTQSSYSVVNLFPAKNSRLIFWHDAPFNADGAGTFEWRDM
jgi:hypothetical protein